ncbi:MAG: hypothetical protein M0R00_08810 [Candidatus Omnitrophica bacterium]|jgi:hypothetical protein|nr:hypothetical protein [Candidatus Omnitrophota bacterium]
MDKYCVSLELAKQLKEAGWKKETEFWWGKLKTNMCNTIYAYEILHLNEDGNFVPLDYINISDNIVSKKDCKFYPAPLATEILELLPNIINPIDDNCRGHYLSISPSVSIKGWQVCYGGYRAKVFIDKSLPNVLAKTWIYLKKEGLIK